LNDAVLANSELADIVDLRYDVLEAPPLEKFHGAQCANLTTATSFCNYVADGANLCAETHSKNWWPFVLCMYATADPDGDTDKDAANPLAHPDKFDSEVATCAALLPDYPVEDLRTCTYGAEGKKLRVASAAKTPTFKGPVWVVVDGTHVDAPNGKGLSRAQWKKDVVRAICTAYKGEKPSACSQLEVIV